MNSKVQRKSFRSQAYAQRQQALLVRAVFGSLVLCAALAPQASAQGTSQQKVSPEIARLLRVNNQTFNSLLSSVVREIDKETYEGLGLLEVTVEAGVDELNTRPFNTSISYGKATEPHWNERDRVIGFVAGFGASGGFNRIENARHLSYTLKLNEQNAGLSAVATVTSELRATQKAQSYNSFLDAVRSAERDEKVVVVLNNMTVSANGKQLIMQLEMSRQQAGNLLRKYVSLP